MVSGDSTDALTKEQDPVELLPICLPVEHTSQASGTRSGRVPSPARGSGCPLAPPAQPLWLETWEQWLCPPQ